MISRRRYRYRYYGHNLPAWLPMAKRREGLMLLYHPGQHHPDQVGPYLEHRRTEDIATVAAETFEVIEEHETAL